MHDFTPQSMFKELNAAMVILSGKRGHLGVRSGKSILQFGLSRTNEALVFTFFPRVESIFDARGEIDQDRRRSAEAVLQRFDNALKDVFGTMEMTNITTGQVSFVVPLLGSHAAFSGLPDEEYRLKFTLL